VLKKLQTNTKTKRIQALQEYLEIERAINFFAISLIDQTTVEEVLWDVAKNCIARLRFIDCVIYQVDEKRNVLIQKAAHGPKNPAGHHIFQPIEIPIGIGIVGSVALKGKGEIIKDTSKDKRYIVDDEVRYSEITIPIICENKVIGVIDAEHPEKNFFKPKHLKILKVIASLCAQKIRKIEIEQAYQHSERQLIETQKRMAEAKLVSLRMQMNPHFIFNSLSAIHHFILQQDTELASKLLTKFSRLLRQVLENAKNEWISLKNELQALQLYVELEQIRCSSKFTWQIQVSENINEEKILLPPFIIQPYVENAIWHGLLPADKDSLCLQVTCRQENDTFKLIVSDNGIGRKGSVRTQTQALIEHKSYGMKIIRERLQLINELYGVNAKVQINDLYDDSKNVAGTMVTFTLKVKYV
jgi:LytS/YehU family sensor histidine kinase